jgi:hypothetical protein
MRIRGGDGTEENSRRTLTDKTEAGQEPAKMIRKVTIDNLPFGHIYDDIVVDNNTPYVRVYCQNVCGIFDREGISLDSAFEEIKQAGAEIFMFNKTHGDESNATARRVLRLSKQRNKECGETIMKNAKLYSHVKSASINLHQTRR